MPTSVDSPLYISRRLARNLWQTYSVYQDRIELRFWFALRTLVIPFEEISELEVRRPLVVPSRHDPPWYRILKLDWADLFPHVSLCKRFGYFQQYRFTPDNPAAFAAACQAFVRG
jgi:hypothetical protein